MLCSNEFITYFPDKRIDMENICKTYIEENYNSDEMIDILTNFGVWVIEQSRKWLDKFNPSRVFDMPRMDY